MNSESASSSTFQGVDIEAQTQSINGDGGSQPSSFHTADSRGHRNSTEPGEERSRATPRSSNIVHSEKSDQDTTGAANDKTQFESEWKPWTPDGPYCTKIPESQATMEDWLKAMDVSDDGVFYSEISNISQAGLFSTTVTVFTIRSCRWLGETQADMLTRLQLRALLNATHDPAIDRLAPATFNASLTSVIINSLQFTSLTLALAAVVISFFCKQWLYEYQRYDNLTTKEAFLIHELRHRGLQAWQVPEIIASLPILLQASSVLFLTDSLVFLWPFHTVVASITTAIVGLTFSFPRHNHGYSFRPIHLPKIRHALCLQVIAVMVTFLHLGILAIRLQQVHKPGDI